MDLSSNYDFARCWDLVKNKFDVVNAFKDIKGA